MTMPQGALRIPIDRTEGDLELHLQASEGRVTEAWCGVTRFRGIEALLQGRAPMDSLVITPRVCGICGTAHLYAAVNALEMLAGITPPPGAVLLRNAAMACEHIQNHLRHHALYLMPGFMDAPTLPAPLAAEAATRYTPLQGTAVRSTLHASRRVVEIIAIIGGQWPHSHYMVPGGMAGAPSAASLALCRTLAQETLHHVETHILGCTAARWHEVDSLQALDAWLEHPAHSQSELGTFLRLSRALQLDALQSPLALQVAFPSFPHPAEQGQPLAANLWPGGVTTRQGNTCSTTPFDHAAITEDGSHSHYRSRSQRHPHLGAVRTELRDDAYSWAKAVRLDAQPAEAGPLADLLAQGNPLARDMFARQGATPVSRHVARISGMVHMATQLLEWTTQASAHTVFYEPQHVRVAGFPDGQAHGLVTAPRGALGHWLTVKGGRIERYQIITPTTWNASPRDRQNTPGPFELAMQGVPLADASNPWEPAMVVRSFDPCSVCAVHAIERPQPGGDTALPATPEQQQAHTATPQPQQQTRTATPQPHRQAHHTATIGADPVPDTPMATTASPEGGTP